MNNDLRGVYQPPMEDGPTYDFGEEFEDEEERSRLPILIVVALIVLAAFSGVVWLAYNQGIVQGRSGAPVVVAASQEPARTAPPAEAGTSTPYTGLKVYNDPVPADQEAAASALAPVPPTPIPQETPRVATAEAPPMRLTPPAAAPAPAATAPTPAPVTAPPPQPAPPPAAAVASAPATPPPAPVAAAPATRTGGAVLQIGAYDSEAVAQAASETFRSRYGAAMGNVSADIQRADLGARGIWFRVRVGPYADRAAAAAACETLKRAGGNCFVAAP